MGLRVRQRTDWNAYYSSQVPITHLTRRYTQGVLLRLMREYSDRQPASIYELGGANSCFYDAIRRSYPDAVYTAIDNNALGLRLLAERTSDEPKTRTLLMDVLAMPDEVPPADIVFSVGLIEHFTPAETGAIIRRHFTCVRPGGLVVITFPTPTWLYRSMRRLAEWGGVWRFPDERPLTFEEVLGQVRRYGDVRETRTNWPVILTQGVVAAVRS